MTVDAHGLIRRVPLFSCPVCHVLIKDYKVNYSELKDTYTKSGSPVPYYLTCKNGHKLLVYLYPFKGKVKVRDVVQLHEVKSPDKKRYNS